MRFGLERRTFLLGEPILARLRVTLTGSGTWNAWRGGNYRARGRDDNFLFLLRGSDGVWLPDTYGRIEVYRGGLSSAQAVTVAKPFEVWNAVQRWCAIDRPGDYELHAFYRAHGTDVIGGRDGLRWATLKASPLAARIDSDVKARVASNHWGLEALTCYARIPIIVRPGRAGDREGMTRRVAEEVGASTSRAMGSRAAALVDAVTFARQDDFLDLIIRQYSSRESIGWLTAAQGLAIRPSQAAFDALLAGGSAKATSASRVMCRENAVRLIPHLMTWLGGGVGVEDDGEDLKKVALSTLRRWAPSGPTKADDVATWRAWWANKADGFVPAPWRPR